MKYIKMIMIKLHYSQVLGLTLLLSLSTPFPARCWLGVIDQINPPWVTITKETGGLVELPLEELDHYAKEGDWVIYWSNQKRLELLNSKGSRMENKRHQDLLNALLQ